MYGIIMYYLTYLVKIVIHILFMCSSRILWNSHFCIEHDHVSHFTY